MKILLVALLSVPVPALAQPAPEIQCLPKENLSDAGFAVTVTKKKSELFHFVFSQNSVAGPQVKAEFDVKLKRAGTAGACEIRAYQATDDSHRFSLVRSGGGRWKLAPGEIGKVPDLACTVREDLAGPLCEKAKREVERAPSLCDEANADSPVCKGGVSAE